MKRIILGVAAAALVLASVAPANAAVVRVGRPGGVVRAPAGVRTGVARVGFGPRAAVAGPYYRANAVRFAGGYYYPGRYHPHWSMTKFSPVYNSTVYYDPGLTSWFYWNAPAARYYPIGYRP